MRHQDRRPDSGEDNIGVMALAVPMNESAGQPEGFALNWFSVHAFWSVGISRAGSAFGSCTSTLPMFAWPGSDFTATSRLAPPALLVAPLGRRAELGANDRLWHPQTSNGLGLGELAPCAP